MSNEMRYDEQDLMACKTSGLFREDAGESVFFAQELQKVKAKTYDVKTPANNAMSIFPVTSEADPGADTVAFDSYDSVGMAKILQTMLMICHVQMLKPSAQLSKCLILLLPMVIL